MKSIVEITGLSPAPWRAEVKVSSRRSKFSPHAKSVKTYEPNWHGAVLAQVVVSYMLQKPFEVLNFVFHFLWNFCKQLIACQTLH